MNNDILIFHLEYMEYVSIRLQVNTFCPNIMIYSLIHVYSSAHVFIIVLVFNYNVFAVKGGKSPDFTYKNVLCQ